MTMFRDRSDAGRQLAARFEDYKGKEDVLVLALPRGGVPVAFEIATAINAPLDVMTVRKLGTPGQPELAMGAIATGGVRVMRAPSAGRGGRISATGLLVRKLGTDGGRALKRDYG